MNCYLPCGTHISCSSAYLILDEDTENEDLYYRVLIVLLRNMVTAWVII